jgi:hypothetical protein
MRTAMLVIPIVVLAPAVLVFVPPPVVRAPAILASLVQLMARAFCLLAVPTMVFDSLMQSVIGPLDSVLALGLIGLHARYAGEEKISDQRRRRQQQFPKLQ